MNITVYCGANVGNNGKYRQVAQELGHWIATNGHTLVYGGGKVGLMAVVADTVLALGGRVIGIMPTFLRDRELAHSGLSELRIVENMSDRKRQMFDLGDVFIALPGGPGTLEEITEVISWSRIGQNAHPCIVFNADNFYDLLEQHYNYMVEEGFLTQVERDKVLFSNDLSEMETFIATYQALEVRKYGI
ncbi:MAG: TIGR00730 family Rossman fold protein [Aerococcaceae bacterium]|nr:TIGR00730 family Rossman fold protein [Aerococcaceae bacterium]